MIHPMASPRRGAQYIIFGISLALAAWAYIQTPEFIRAFPTLARTSAVQTLAPRTANFFTFQKYSNELKALKNKPESLKQVCTVFGRDFGFNPNLRFNHYTLDAVYRSTLATCLLEGTATPKNPELAVTLVEGLDDIPSSSAVVLGYLLVKNGKAEQGTALLNRSFLQGNAEAGTMLASFYMNGEYLPLDWNRAYWFFVRAAGKGKSVAATNAAFIAVQGRVEGTTEADFQRYLDQSLALKRDKVALVLQAWAYANGVGYPQDLAKAQQLATEARSATTQTRLYVTDFFNQQGWGKNPALTQSLLLMFYQSKLIDLSARRDLFFTPNGPTPLHEALQKSLLANGVAKKASEDFLRDLAAAPTKTEE